MAEKLLYKDVTDKIIKSFYNVYNELGGGFSESVYEKALTIELNSHGLHVINQKSI